MSEQTQEQRTRCFKTFQTTRRDEDKLLNIIGRLKREAKIRYENNVISSLSNTKLNTRQFWSLSHSVMGCNSDRVIPLLKLTSKKTEISIAFALPR